LRAFAAAAVASAGVRPPSAVPSGGAMLDPARLPPPLVKVTEPLSNGTVEVRDQRPAAVIAELDRARRGAEQQLHAERAGRIELEEEHETEIEAWRRRAAEAEQVAAVAMAERRAARGRLAAGLRAELLIARLAPRAGLPLSMPVTLAPVAVAALAIEGRMVEARASARSPLELEPRLLALRDALRDVRTLAERELGESVARATPAHPSIEGIRAQLQALRVPARARDPAGVVESTRLEDALARLRNGGAPADEAPADGALADEAPVYGAPAHTTAVWLAPAFRRLVAQDADRAGRLFVALVPAQWAAYPQPAAYDLVLSDAACIAVTADAGVTQVAFRPAPRSRDQVGFQVTGDFARVARLLVAGRFRRRLRWRLARVRGERSLAALQGLIEAPLTLRQLHSAGVRLDPALTFALAAQMIDPMATSGERFTIVHQPSRESAARPSLTVRNGARPSVGAHLPLAPAETTIICPPDLLLPVLAGMRQAEAVVSGEQRPLELVQGWLQAAQRA
jgi:hypothetical protein